MTDSNFTLVRRPQLIAVGGGLRVGGTSAPSFGDDL